MGASPVAGKVLAHSISSIERVLSKWNPVIFKIGFTHDPSWRWSNSLYGYSKAKEKWAHMVVLYISGEPYGPAMLEAALIREYQGVSPCNI